MIKEKYSMGRMVWWSMHGSSSVETGVQHLGNHNRNWLASLQEDTGLLTKCNQVSIRLVWVLTDNMITTMTDILSVLFMQLYSIVRVKNSISFNLHGEFLEYKKLQTYSVMVTSSDPRLSLIAPLKPHIALQYPWRLRLLLA